MKKILNIALFIGISTYLFWVYLPKGSFYIGNALFIFLLCLYMFVTDKKSVIKFILVSLCLNNLMDEIFFDNTKLQLNEILLGITVLIIGFIKYKNARKRTNIN